MTEWKFYRNSQDAWEAMYDDCSRAEHSIDFEQYIIQDDTSSERFFALFKKKAASGVRVRMLCDMVGSYALYESPRSRELRDSGVDVLFFNPISAWRITNFTAWFFRDHRKLLVVDSDIGHTGGVGLNKKTARWRDTHIRIRGPVVRQMQMEFEKMWIGEKEGTFVKSRTHAGFHDQFAFMTIAPHVRQRHFYREFLSVIKKARSYVYLTTPYFVPPLRFFNALRRVARRGVDVRLLLPATSDFRIVDSAAFSFFGTAMKSGVKIFLYQGPLIHAKTCIIDDTWGTVGSTNLDNQSFAFNHEANLVSKNSLFVEELKKQYFEDLTHAQEVSRRVWERRPLSQRIYEILTWPIHWAL